MKVTMDHVLRLNCPLVLLLVLTAVAEGAEKKVFLFAGQSNTAAADALIGGNGVKDLAGLGSQTEADRSTRFTFGMNFVATGPLSYAWGDVRGHRGVSRGAAEPPHYVHGPEVGFARTLYSHGVRDVAIIAVSSNVPTPPKGPEWPWTNKDATTASPDYYGRWSSFVNARLAELTSNGDTYTVAGFVWDEGIDDAINRATQAQYTANLSRLVAMLRSDYGKPTTPVLIVRSKSAMVPKAAMDAIREAQVAVSKADRHAAWVSSDDLPNANIHHFPATSQLVIGQRLGDAYLALTMSKSSAKTNIHSGKP
jgi:hypothetical protein